MNTQNKVKTMNKILELMNDLHSDDMQARHWEKLSLETGSVINPEDPGFAFKHLYKVQLHK